MAIANRTCVSFCKKTAISLRHIIWLRQESLRHILASPGYVPRTIAVNVTWIERELNAGQTPRSIYPSIFNYFWNSDISVASDWFSTVNEVNVRFFKPHFAFPWVRPWDNRGIFYMDGKGFNADQTHRSMCPSIFNRLRAIARYWSETATFIYLPCI